MIEPKLIETIVNANKCTILGIIQASGDLKVEDKIKFIKSIKKRFGNMDYYPEKLTVENYAQTCAQLLEDMDLIINGIPDLKLKNELLEVKKRLIQPLVDIAEAFLHDQDLTVSQVEQLYNLLISAFTSALHDYIIEKTVGSIINESDREAIIAINNVICRKTLFTEFHLLRIVITTYSDAENISEELSVILKGFLSQFDELHHLAIFLEEKRSQNRKPTESGNTEIGSPSSVRGWQAVWNQRARAYSQDESSMLASSPKKP